MTEPGDDSREARIQEGLALQEGRSPLARFLWLVLGIVFVAIGAVGIIIPGLPTTPFMLLAAACFARSSPRLYEWLLRNRTFGPLIDDYRAGRGVSARVKGTAITVMTLFVAFALSVPLRGKMAPAIIVGSLALFGAAYILRLPTRPPRAS